VVPFLHITTKVDGDPDQSLSQEKGGIGWPYLIAMDSDGTVIVRNIEKRKQTVATFRDIIDAEVPAYLALKAAAAKGDDDALVAFLKKRIELANISFAEASAERNKLSKLDAEQAASLDQALVELEVDELFASIKERNPRGYAKAAPIAARMAEAGRIPEGKARARNFWRLVGMYAQSSKDQELAKRARAALKKIGR